MTTEHMNLEQAYREMAEKSPLFQVVWDKEIEEWKDDGGVLGTIVFGHFANAITEQIDVLDSAELAAIFAKLDELLLIGNQQVGEAVATGFLEALLSEVASGDLDIARVRQYIGPEAADYCLAWDPKTFNAS